VPRSAIDGEIVAKEQARELFINSTTAQVYVSADAIVRARFMKLAAMRVARMNFGLAVNLFFLGETSL